MAGTDLTPPFCTTLQEAWAAMARPKSRWPWVVCRTVLNGHSGKGIVLAKAPEEMVEAPLYVKYIKKSEEFRAHVIRGKLVDVQRKGRNRAVPDDAINWQVRNHANGFIYAREGVERWLVSGELERAALRTIEICSLDFGAVDLIWNEREDKFYVLEVNTAPGLEGTTLHRYVEGFKGAA